MSVHTFAVQEEPLVSSAGAAPTGPEKPSRRKSTHAIKCSVCDKVFKRSEHCARHELSHTDQRPYSCQFCHKSYARKDLLKRHEKTIHASLYNALVEKQTADADTRDSQTQQLADTATTQDSDMPPPPASWARTSTAEPIMTAPAASHFAMLDDEAAVTGRAETAPAVACSTKRTISNSLDVDTADVVSRAPSTALALPATATAATNPSSHSARFAQPMPPLSLDARSSVPSPPHSPTRVTEHFDFSLGSILAASPFDTLAGLEPHPSGFEDEQPHNKRQRLCQSDRGPPEHSIPNEHGFSLTAPSPMLAGGDSRSLLYSSSLFDIDLMMGDASHDFFFHQIAQPQNSTPGASGSTRNVLCPTEASGLGYSVPNACSPSGQLPDFISDSGTDKSDRIRLPMILKERSENPPRLVVDEVAFQALFADVNQRLGGDDVKFPLKNRRDLQHFLTGYLDCFHRHLPILHLPTIQVSQTPSPLILAMCCIGALYRLERQRARNIYYVATRLLEAESVKQPYSSPLAPHCSLPPDAPTSGNIPNLRPLWSMQTRLLLLLYGALNDDSATVQSELARLGIFITDYRARRVALQAKIRQSSNLSWLEWVEIEATKRYLCASFICSSLIVLIYDIPPGVGITRDLEVEVLETEKLWTAATAEDWQSLRNNESSSPTRTIRSVMGDMLAGKTNDNIHGCLYHISGFTTLVIIHSLNMYAWNLSQLSHVSISPNSDLSGVTSNTLLANALMTLGRCREVLQLAKPEGIESIWNTAEAPLLLNCEAMLRVAYTRLFLGSNMPESVMLLLSGSDENMGLLSQFVAARQERSPLITKVMASMCEAFSVPSKAGYLLVQKTAAINWSVEHAVASWGCVLLLSKWLYCLDVQVDNMPLATAELEIVSAVKAALDGMGGDYDEKGSLAAAVVASWAPLMSDVWVWGVTQKMGLILKGLAQVYETMSKRARIHRLKT